MSEWRNGSNGLGWNVANGPMGCLGVGIGRLQKWNCLGIAEMREWIWLVWVAVACDRMSDEVTKNDWGNVPLSKWESINDFYFSVAYKRVAGCSGNNFLRSRHAMYWRFFCFGLGEKMPYPCRVWHFLSGRDGEQKTWQYIALWGWRGDEPLWRYLYIKWIM